jgi:hypothetical protein
MDSTQTAKFAASIDSSIKPEIAEGLKLSLWGIDSLVISPIAIDIDDLVIYIIPLPTVKKILNLISAVTAIGRSNPYRCKLSKINAPFCIESYLRKIVRRMNGWRFEWRQFA